VQVVVEETSKLFNIVSSIPKESVICVKGRVVRRKSVNKEMVTGEFEIIANAIDVINISKTPPILIQDQTDALEDTRLKYRYLDLRRPTLQRNLITRMKVINGFRDYLQNKDFIEIETPILAKPTVEGAKFFLVPSNVNSKYYALPQSPQLFKQLLMVAGIDRYFQLARCFRNEDMRSDRQPEFTQFDMEFSFVNEESVMSTVEEMMISTFNKVLGVKLVENFERMTYETCMMEYGNDKPDLRFGIKINNVTSKFSTSKFNLFKEAEKNGNTVKSLFINKVLDKKQIAELEDTARENGLKGLA
jgi:aspartyl-tRNA synthetase